MPPAPPAQRAAPSKAPKTDAMTAVAAGVRHPEKMTSGCPRFYFAGANHVYAVISSRARGLAVGVNLNPDQYCNCECCYCEVDRRALSRAIGPVRVNAHAVAGELSSALAMVNAGLLLRHPYFASLPADMLRLAHVAISGDGEPTLCPNFSEVIEGVVHLRAAGIAPYFKLVLITNGTVLEQPQVRSGLRLFTRADELWVKLDAGTSDAMERINGASVPFSQILANIREVGRLRPLVIQSMFVELDGCLPERGQLSDYAHCLNELKEAGVRISLVQIYSATRPPHSKRCRHLSLRVLSEIASYVHQVTGLPVEVF